MCAARFGGIAHGRTPRRGVRRRRTSVAGFSRATKWPTKNRTTRRHFVRLACDMTNARRWGLRSVGAYLGARGKKREKRGPPSHPMNYYAAGWYAILLFVAKKRGRTSVRCEFRNSKISLRPQRVTLFRALTLGSFVLERAFIAKILKVNFLCTCCSFYCAYKCRFVKRGI